MSNACKRGVPMYAHILIATDGSDLAQRAVDQGLALAKALGSAVTAVTVTEPWTAAVSGEWAVAFIVEEAKARNCDLIVMASHGRRGIAKFVLGSQATRVLAHSSVPLLVCR